MTLLKLQKLCERIGRQMTSADIPLKMYGNDCEISLKLCGDNGNYWVEVRSSIDHDEKVAIIMQMFEDGVNDSIAMAIANRIKQGVIDKACEWLEDNLSELVRDQEMIGTICRYMYKKDNIEQFRKAMQ